MWLSHSSSSLATGGYPIITAAAMVTMMLLSTTTTEAFSVGTPQTTTVLSTPPPLHAQQRKRTSPLPASTTNTEENLETSLTRCLSVLNRAAESKQEDAEAVYTALVDLEKLSRQAAKADASYTDRMLSSLNGSWRLVFTTGTANTQKKFGKINYFPLKAVQSFDVDTMKIENGIYLGDFCALKFSGTFEFDMKKRKLEFDFDRVMLLQTFDIVLKQGEAAGLGAASGLGSESNVANAQRSKSAFFNWISADTTIATARGGGGGLALWKRVH